MKTAGYLPFIVNEIHTTVVATVDDEGLPVTAAIDMSSVPPSPSGEHHRNRKDTSLQMPVSAAEAVRLLALKAVLSQPAFLT